MLKIILILLIVSQINCDEDKQTFSDGMNKNFFQFIIFFFNNYLKFEMTLKNCLKSIFSFSLSIVISNCLSDFHF